MIGISFPNVNVSPEESFNQNSRLNLTSELSQGGTVYTNHYLIRESSYYFLDDLLDQPNLLSSQATSISSKSLRKLKHLNLS
jgi:hypothetical protein